MALKARIEAVLFVTARAVTIEEVAEILNEEPAEVESAMLDLIMDYSTRETALEIDDEDGYIIQVKQDHIDIVEKLVPVELSPAIIRTLSVIAIKEPIRQRQLVDLRGQTAYDHIQELTQKGLITKTKDPKNPRSLILKTTDKFAEYFKLKGDTKALAKILNLENKV